MASNFWIAGRIYVSRRGSFLFHGICTRISLAFSLKELVKNGTTTCAAYATVHPASVTALFSVATEYNMCILAGKVMMNRNAPDYLMDTTHQGELDCRSLIEDWDGKGRNHYVITPPFRHNQYAGSIKVCRSFTCRISQYLYTDTSFGESGRD